VTGPSAVSPLAPSDTQSRRSRGPLIFAIILSVAWIVTLIVMAWLTANPVVLNRDQILRADDVITGKVDSDPRLGEVSVVREWKKQGHKATIHVENLEEAGARKGETYLMPLAPAATGYRVAEARLANSAVLIYPATPPAIEQLEAILGDQAQKK
jgi:hypothetical protein